MLSNPPFALKNQAERLIVRLKGLVKQVERQWGLHVHLTMAGLDSGVPETLPHDIYYLVRETLLNAARHAGACR